MVYNLEIKILNLRYNNKLGLSLNKWVVLISLVQVSTLAVIVD